MSKLERDFYLRKADLVAPNLLGKVLVHKSADGVTSGIIVEVEAYIGPEDKGSHAYLNKRTVRTEIQFGNGGYAYIYTIYGLHYCFNVVTNKENKPEVVLIRAVEPVNGLELMKKRRKIQNTLELCNGPGKLCAALGISNANYGDDLCGDTLFIEDYLDIPLSNIVISPRVNIDYAEEYKDVYWRYYIKDNKYVSKVNKKYSSNITLEMFQA